MRKYLTSDLHYMVFILLAYLLIVIGNAGGQNFTDKAPTETAIHYLIEAPTSMLSIILSL
jgi:hypothetical protein